MLFTTNWLSKVFPDFKGKLAPEAEIDEVTTDSRNVGGNSLFIPIVGDNFDGHDFANQAIEAGAGAMLWDKNKEIPNEVPEDYPLFLVEDTLKALQRLAAHYRNDINPIVIGITGSNGKTTTKDLTAAVTQTSYRTHYTNGNFNNHIGLPLTILSMKRDTEVLILEMGMSNFGEIELLTKLARPDYAIITNIGESHIEFLGSREGIAKAKLEIVKGLKENGVLIVDGDEPLLQNLQLSQRVISNGFTAENDNVLTNISIVAGETAFQLSDGFRYKIPLLGKHHAKNASFAITIGKLLNIDAEKCSQAFDTLSRTAMRFELIKGKNGVTIINDAYNASPTSMKAAIEVVKQMDGFEQKVLILGDILELGSHSEELHRSIAYAIESPITAVYTYGEDAKLISEEVKDNQINCQHYLSKEELANALEPYLSKDALLLFKASRGLKFETMIAQILEETK
ncbi:UDP-N-acetylmuramoyl-tripeptide--D-alanyl-D-alanine ligase [Oceanobacillus massiliensis]|uniref:UDP-N-acetylmuramoyl-tripeptide--D-alanyl-D- alanine ligase n=1 Tax=Oceanobacillus massiliensis TaxID=1465765 RepID=UPI000289A502|nr:UDP-N-acetylmuramoyl-tripeptide--D-alanyl-D-alanine ligase [Oceanobacillus massiliensis]